MNQQPTAIVVDDSKAFLMYLSVLLNRMNLEVLPVSNAREALELARVTRPDLMTLDMVMPDQDGLQTLQALRDDPDLQDLPVIMISSYQDKTRQWEALSLGCIDILDKPLDLRRLHKALQGANLFNGGRRRYLRAAFSEKVELVHDGNVIASRSVTLSERGIYVRGAKSLSTGETVAVRLPMPEGDCIEVGGQIIYRKAENGGQSMVPPGVAIRFNRLTKQDIERLSTLVTELLIGDIAAEQPEVFAPPT